MPLQDSFSAPKNSGQRFLKASILETILSRIYVFRFGQSVPGKDYKLGRPSARPMSILNVLDV